MKKLMLVLAMFICFTVNASVSNSEKVFEEVEQGYNVGYTIDSCTVLGSDMHMWHFENVVEGWYVAYNMNKGEYYYITQDAAQQFIEDTK